MTKRPLFIAAVLLVAAGLVSRAATQNSDLQQVVEQFYPFQRLALAGNLHSCHEVLDTTPTNEPSLIVAAYADRSSGAVRVLRRRDTGMVEVAFDHPETWRLPGARSGCAIRLQDVDFDGQPEVFVYFQGTRASVGWIFSWDDSTLSSLTPTDAGGGRGASVLLDPVAYDLEHSGPLRVIAATEVSTTVPGVRAGRPAFVYRLGPSGYEVESSILAVMGFRADVDPRGNLRTFRLVTDSSPPFTLRIINGDRSGGNRVTGATILVNNEEVLGPAQVNERTQFTTAVLPSVFIQNHVTATLTGPPEGYIIMLVEDSTER